MLSVLTEYVCTHVYQLNTGKDQINLTGKNSSLLLSFASGGVTIFLLKHSPLASKTPALLGKEPARQCRRCVSLILQSGRSPGEENGNPLQYSCLGNSMDRGAWQAIVHGVQRVRHDLVTHHQQQTNPCGPVVKNPPCNMGDLGLIPGRGTKIPHAVEKLNPRATVRVLQWKIPCDATMTQHS